LTKYLFFFLSSNLTKRNHLNPMDISGKKFERNMNNWREDYSCCLSIFLTLELHGLSISFCKSTRVARHFSPLVQLFSMRWIKCAIVGVAHWKRSRYGVISKKNVQRDHRLNSDTLAAAKEILRKLRKE